MIEIKRRRRRRKRSGGKTWRTRIDSPGRNRSRNKSFPFDTDRQIGRQSERKRKSFKPRNAWELTCYLKVQVLSMTRQHLLPSPLSGDSKSDTIKRKEVAFLAQSIVYKHCTRQYHPKATISLLPVNSQVVDSFSLSLSLSICLPSHRKLILSMLNGLIIIVY